VEITFEFSQRNISKTRSSVVKEKQPRYPPSVDISYISSRCKWAFYTSVRHFWNGEREGNAVIRALTFIFSLRKKTAAENRCAITTVV
jgi:hypothetical protein